MTVALGRERCGIPFQDCPGAWPRRMRRARGPPSPVISRQAPSPIFQFRAANEARAAPPRPLEAARRRRWSHKPRGRAAPRDLGSRPSLAPAAQMACLAPQSDRWPMEQSMDAEMLDEPSLLLPRAGGVSPPTTPRRRVSRDASLRDSDPRRRGLSDSELTATPPKRASFERAGSVWSAAAVKLVHRPSAREYSGSLQQAGHLGVPAV